MIEDNGVGGVSLGAAASKQGAPRGGGLGLALLRRRAQQGGGRVQIRSASRQGTSLHVSWRLGV